MMVLLIDPNSMYKNFKAINRWNYRMFTAEDKISCY